MTATSARAEAWNQRARSGDRVALARLLTLAERGGDEFATVHPAIHAAMGHAHRIGFTGPPGAGKSTLVEAYALDLRKRQESVAVICVDPTSPFTGGALLGDRVRMNRLTLDPGCFVRSMASRGWFGGLARTSEDVADVFDSVGYDRVLIETVGVGQSEIDVARAADTTVVVLVPGTGDAVQAMKAGLMEVADLFVVNKADRPGVERVVAELEEVLQLRADAEEKPAIVQTVAMNGEGIDELARRIDEHRARCASSGRLATRRAARAAEKVRRLLEQALRERTFAGKGMERRIEEALQSSTPRSPYAVARELLLELGLVDQEARKS